MLSAIAELSKHLDVSDMGELKKDLGITFTRENNGAWFIQSAYTKKILGKKPVWNTVSLCMLRWLLERVKFLAKTVRLFHL